MEKPPLPGLPFSPSCGEVMGLFPGLLVQESGLAHVELPTTVETVEAAIKKHKDFTTTMELNLHRIKAVIEAGESLISQNNIYSERIRERIDTLANRCFISMIQDDYCDPSLIQDQQKRWIITALK